MSSKYPQLADKNWLRSKYWDEWKSIPDIAEELGCGIRTVHRWLKKHNIERRGYHDYTRHAPLTCHQGSRPCWHPTTGYKLMVSQAVAIAKGYSIDEVFGDDMVVHHRNGIPWDNRPENIEVMGRGDHNRLHRLVESGVKQFPVVQP